MQLTSRGPTAVKPLTVRPAPADQKAALQEGNGTQLPPTMEFLHLAPQRVLLLRGLDEVAVDSRCPFLVYQPRERMQQGAMVYKCAVWASAMH